MDKTFKARRYRPYRGRYEPIPIIEIDSLAHREGTSDSSVGDSVSQNWITDKVQSPYARWNYELFIRPQEPYFVGLLLKEDFSVSDHNLSTNFIWHITKKYKESVQIWILDLFKARQGDAFFLMQLLRLLRCFPYEMFAPASFYIAGLGVHHNSDFVKSEALSLLSHWGNKDVLDMLRNFEPPFTPWLQIKYIAIRESLERYVALQENR